MNLLRVSLQACHSVADNSSMQDVEVTFPGSQSSCPPAGVVKGLQYHQRSMTLELQILFSFCLRQDLMWPPTCYVTMDDFDSPASTSNAGIIGVSHYLQMSQPFVFHFVCSLPSCLVEHGGSHVVKTQAGGGQRNGAHSASGVVQMFRE